MQNLGVELDSGPIEGSSHLIWRKYSSFMVIRNDYYLE